MGKVVMHPAKQRPDDAIEKINSGDHSPFERGVRDPWIWCGCGDPGFRSEKEPRKATIVPMRKYTIGLCGKYFSPDSVLSQNNIRCHI